MRPLEYKRALGSSLRKWRGFWVEPLHHRGFLCWTPHRGSSYNPICWVLGRTFWKDSKWKLQQETKNSRRTLYGSNKHFFPPWEWNIQKANSPASPPTPNTFHVDMFIDLKSINSELKSFIQTRNKKYHWDRFQSRKSSSNMCRIQHIITSL